MKDSFNNEIQVGDRILCIEPREEYSHRELQVGIVCGITKQDIVIDFLNSDYSSIEEILDHLLTCINPTEDIFIKIDTHKEVEYRVGDKVFYYFHSFINKACSGTIVEKHSNSLYTIQNEFEYIHPVASSEILFLLERDDCEIENEVIKIIKIKGGLK
ncbi:MAG: hypothetical protein MSA15_20485 [Clostridium sp.]|nr:hypothetical protein [Clostridium sp.]